ncbi:snRNA-activating protein complex subunit 1b [Astyanax mexicanus]|uniref:Small nuclear RNA activating complex polypeptide 1 n=1 Tax=Astyanax mexicanus TaxID=7994 RepID=A0A8B9GNF0_ASTMX|nr:snRNA-activating protein complex subunit 1b [Astyanax mexicanus]KAG9274895.1 snRNA-activating protein complex subunit 1 [Astyanax mexicanus]
MEHYKASLQTDCEQILGSFQASNSVRFEEFSKIWKQTDFSSIFHGISQIGEKRIFTRLALTVASPYLFPPYTFQIRVGGLYLLYGLYNSQSVTPKEKIRMALKDWSDLIKFQQDAVNAQHYDVVYILKKLLSDKALYFTAMPDPLSFNAKRKQKEGGNLNEMFVDRPSRPQELISTDMLEELANVHEHYEKLKQAVSAQAEKPELNLVKQNMVPKLHSAVVSYYSWQQNHTEFESQDAESDRGAGEGTSSQEESSRRAKLLESIKARSYGQAVEASRSRRHRQVEVTSAATNSEPAAGSSRYTSKAPSLKERTELRFLNQGDQNEGLQGVTRIWRLSAVEKEKIEEGKRPRFNWSSEREGDEA